MKTHQSEISEAFHAAFCHSGSLVIDCEFCGRTYFSERGDYEEGEYEKLIAKAKLEPDKYIEGDGDNWHWYHLGGKQYVVGCKCEGALSYEKFIWANRRQIATYLKLRTEKELKAAQANADIAASIPQ